MKINDKNVEENKLNWVYLTGFFIILALPLLAIPPYFFPPDWGKTIVFRSIMAILLFLFAYQFLFRKNEILLPNFRKNKSIWVLSALFIVFLLATIFSVDPYFSFWGSPWRGGGFVTFAFYFVFAILTFILFKKEDWKKTWDFSIVIGILVSLVAIIQYHGLFNRIFLSVPDRPPSTMGNPILLAIYLLLLSFIILSLAIKEKNLWKKTLYLLSLVLFSYVILITGSRAAYLGLATGVLYFFLFYPSKMKVIKIATIGLLILAAGFVFYANTVNQYPNFLQQNRFFNSITQRISIRGILIDSRFYAWTGIDYKILIEKPLLGYGPENFAVGFDKYYNPLVPNIKSEGDWWDRAHNILLDIGAQAGIPAIIIYLLLFVVLFWQLHKAKTADLYGLKTDLYGYSIETHAIQATLVGYLVANFFSFDSFSTYIVFFLLIGYSLHLTAQNNTQNGTQINTKQKNTWWKFVFIFALFCVLAIFLWQYNFVPFEINAKINKARDLANRKYCGQALGLMEKILPEHSFLDSYARMEYVEFTKTCNDYFPENNLTYTKRGLELIKEAVKIQPYYTRYWIFLGSATTTLAAQEKDPDTKNNLLKQANNYFNEALQLSPKRQEISIGQTKMEMVTGDYKNATDYSKKCIALNSDLGGCYWYLALSEIYLKNNDGAKKNTQIAIDKGYDVNSRASLSELSDAYGSLLDYKNLIIVYEKLIKINPSFAQYHSSLAFFYKELGEYAKARQEALRVLELSPESKQNIDEFLRTLP